MRLVLPIRTPTYKIALFTRVSNMSFLFSWLWGASPDPREKARDSIVALREQLLVLDKREDHLQRKIDEELAKAKANVATNKACEYIAAADRV